MDNRKLLIHVRRKAECLAQTDISEGLQTVIRKTHIRRADVENEGGSDQVGCPEHGLGGGEGLRRVRIVRVNSVVDRRAGLVQRSPARIAPEDPKLVGYGIVETAVLLVVVPADRAGRTVVVDRGEQAAPAGWVAPSAENLISSADTGLNRLAGMMLPGKGCARHSGAVRRCRNPTGQVAFPFVPHCVSGS